MDRTRTNLPFKISEARIVVVRALPVFQCQRCPEYGLEDPTLERVDEILRQADVRAELEIVRFVE
jgi:YgiT-type zinc finger domain-containing protein